MTRNAVWLRLLRLQQTREEIGMKQDASYAKLTLALNTALERDFVSPLTAIRGVLEILRDYDDLSATERSRFLDNALHDCARLEQGIEQLAANVYAAADAQQLETPAPKAGEASTRYDARIHFDPDTNIIDIDFSELVFSSSAIVNDFYNRLDYLIERTGQRWYILANYRDCRIWPEAWVAFAHRGKKVNVSYSLGTLRYVEADSDDDPSRPSDPEIFPSRAAAFEHIQRLRKDR
jgi:hypothetical protein